MTKEERTRLWWEFAQSIGDALAHDDISAEVHEGLCKMLENILPDPEMAPDYYRRRITDAAFALMPDDILPPRRLNRDEPWIADIFNGLGEDVGRILKDDKTPLKVRQALIDFVEKMDARARELDPERRIAYQAQMLFPLTLDVVNDGSDDDDEQEGELWPQSVAIM